MLGPRLVIAGAGDFAREVLWACSDIPSGQREWQSVCFIDDGVEAARSRMKQQHIDMPVISTIQDFLPAPQDLLVCAIGNPKAKLAVCERLKARGARFTNVIHPTAAIAPHSSIGEGVILMRFSIISVDVCVGNYVTINTYSGCGHDAVVEDGCTISAHCDITGHAHLERGVFLGSHAAVVPGVRIGSFATIGAGTVAFRDVKAGQTVLGVPAKILL